MQETERIVLFTGHFGSGKTELAVNYAMRLAAERYKTVIVDLDIVNPFFRTAQIRNILEKKEIKVLAPNFAATTMDIPSLPPDIYSVFQNKEYKVVFDVGGDEVGATALGMYHPYFMKEPYRMFYVINVRRPLSSRKEDIIKMLKAIEACSRLKVTDLINNTNLSYETEVQDIVEGQVVVEEVSKETGIPITYISGISCILERLPAEYREKAFPIDIYFDPLFYLESGGLRV